MTDAQIQAALADIAAETDPIVGHLKMAGLCSAVFHQAGVELTVVGGAAVEFFTEGAYVSGDIDLCVVKSSEPLGARFRQEIMGRLGAVGGPRSWQIVGLFVDVLGSFENLSRSPIRKLATPFGAVSLAPPEELLVERVLISTYPQPYPPARDCACKLAAAALQNEIELDWLEVRRLADHRAYRNWPDVRALVNEQAKTLKIRSPYHSHA